MLLSDSVWSTLITTLGTTIVSVTVAVARRRTRNELRQILREHRETSADVRQVKRDVAQRISGEYLATSDVPVKPDKPILGDKHGD